MMKIVAVDNEPRALHMLEILLEQLDFEKEVHAFQNPEEALRYMQENEVDIALLDIDMPGLNGIDLAEALLEIEDPPAVVFVTGYYEYAHLAWGVEAIDYILKPYSKEQIMQAITRYQKKFRPLRRIGKGEHKVRIQCFPNFDVFVDEKPIKFRHKKSKELMAFMVHNQGAWVSVDKVIFALFEACDEEAAKNYYRGILFRLRQMLAEVGIPYIIETGYGKCRVDNTKFTCDYYEYLAGETNLFRGEYMSEYSWAEATTARMQNR